MTSEPTPRHPLRETIEGVVRGAQAILTPMYRERRERWGSTPEEVSRSLPGDELLPEVRWTSTHSITINARPEEVWPWIVQIGQGRGGFYSYQTLENLLGCHIKNADKVLQEFQTPKPGDVIRMHPGDSMPVFKVARVEPPQTFLLGGPAAYDEKLKMTIGVTWLFYLEPKPLDCTRLIVRWRTFYDPDTVANRMWFGPLLVENLDFVMETKMLEGIKQRVEAKMLADDPARVADYQLPIAP